MSIEEQFGLTAEGELNAPEISEEQETIAEGEADLETEVEAAGEEAIAAEDSTEDEVKPKRSKMIPRDRFDEVNTLAKQLQQELAKAQWERDQERLANQKLLGLTKEPEPEDEVLDTALESKLGAEIAALKQQQIDNAIETELTLVRAQAPEILDAHYHLITALVNQSAVKAKAAGYQVTPEQLFNYAKEQIDSELRVVKQRGGSVAEFIYQAAQANGFNPKTAGKKQESVVNMKEVKRLREEAGAPAIQRQAISTGAGDAIKQKIRAENKALGIDESRAALFGL